MVFENHILTRVSTTNNPPLTLEEFCEWNDIEIIEAHNIREVSSSIIELSQKLLFDYMSYNDLITFLTASLNKKEKHIRYVLNPPYTTSKLDAEYLLSLLVNCKILTDVSYSSNSKSFWIEADLRNNYSMRDILNIGLCRYLASISNCSDSTRFSVKLNVSGNEECASSVLLYNGKLKIITIANAIGLEADIVSHTRQLERLKRKVFKTRKTFCDIDDIIIVTPYVQQLLPSSSKIVSIDKIKELGTLLLT